VGAVRAPSTGIEAQPERCPAVLVVCDLPVDKLPLFVEHAPPQLIRNTSVLSSAGCVVPGASAHEECDLACVRAHPAVCANSPTGSVVVDGICASCLAP